MHGRFVIYTDGSAIGNPGPGGWAALLIQGERHSEIAGGTVFTTASEMELTAAIEALKSVPESAEVTLYSDSQYLIQGMRYLVQRWQEWGWRNRRGRILKHRLLWEQLLAVAATRRVQWKWVPGHGDDARQCHVDGLAFRQAREYQMRGKMAA
jgi:ribonuclease HI